MRKEMVAPLTCGIMVIVVLTLYGAAVIWAPLPWIVKIAASVMLVGVVGAMVYVLVQRHKEVEREADDDLSQY